jgi:hypothetical protein
VASLKEAAFTPQAPDCRHRQRSGGVTPRLSPSQPATLSPLNFLHCFFYFFQHSTLARYDLLVFCSFLISVVIFVYFIAVGKGKGKVNVKVKVKVKLMFTLEQAT